MQSVIYGVLVCGPHMNSMLSLFEKPYLVQLKLHANSEDGLVKNGLFQKMNRRN